MSKWATIAIKSGKFNAAIVMGTFLDHLNSPRQIFGPHPFHEHSTKKCAHTHAQTHTPPTLHAHNLSAKNISITTSHAIK